MKLCNLAVLGLLLINLKSNPCGKVYHVPSNYLNPACVAFSPDGSLLATTSSDTKGHGAVIVFSVTDGALSDADSYELPSGAVPYKVTYSPNGSLLATLNLKSNSVTMFQVVGQGGLAYGQSYSLPSGCKFPVAITFSPDSSLLAVANANSNNVVVFKSSEDGILTDATSYVLPAGDKSPSSLAFSPDGTLLATANSDSTTVTVFQVSAGTLMGGVSYKLPSGSKGPQALAFSPDGSLLATANHDSTNLSLFTVSSGQLHDGVTHGLADGCPNPTSIVFSSDGSQIAVGGAINGVTIVTRANGELDKGVYYELSTIIYPASIAFLPSTPYLACGSGPADIGGEFVSSDAVVMLNTTEHCAVARGCNGACIAYLVVAGIVGAGGLLGCGMWLYSKCCSRASEHAPLLG